MSREVRASDTGRVNVVEAHVHDPASGEVRIAVRRCGICGSDLHWFHGRMAVPSVCPGHEISGVVEATGPSTDGWAEGDRVTVEPLVRCRRCPLCARGDYHLCRKLGIHGVTLPGGMASSLVVPTYSLHALPDVVDFEVGALAEPLAVAVHAMRLGAVGSGSNVMILGAGTIGLLSVVAAKYIGAEFIAITARHQQQRTLAQRLGANQVLASDRTRDVEQRPQAVIETVGGTAPTVDDAVRSVARGGTVVITGLFDGTPTFDPLVMLMKEVRLVGSNTYNRPAGEPSDFEIAIEILSDRKQELRELVTHLFPLEQAQQAFETASDKSTGAVKVMLDPAS